MWPWPVEAEMLFCRGWVGLEAGLQGTWEGTGWMAGNGGQR